MTPADLRAQADRADAEAERLEKAGVFAKATFDRQAKAQRDMAAAFRDVAEKMERRGIETILTSGAERTNIRDTMQVENVARGRKVGRPLEGDHAFPAWLRSQNITVTEWAAGHKDPDTGKPYKRERVKSWFASGAGGRPAPRHAIDEIEKESMDEKTGKSAVPATKRTWKNGIRE